MISTYLPDWGLLVCPFLAKADELLAKREPEGEPAEAKSSPPIPAAPGGMATC